MKGVIHTGILAVFLVLLAACSESDDRASAPRVNIPYTPQISINEIMVAQIDHAAHFIWDATNPENPASQIDWEEVEHHAIQLLSSRAAMTMGGTGVNDAMWVAQTSWRDYVIDMSGAARQALASAREKDRVGLNLAGARLIDACQSCHEQFKPDVPTEGYSAGHDH